MTKEQIRQAADVVLESVSAKDYAPLIGLKIARNGFTQCPFHNGDHTGSMKLYDGTRGFHCFGCGASGDVIELAKRFYGLSFPQAIAKVAEDVGIALPGTGKMTYEQAKVLQAARDRKAALERQQREEQAAEEAYWPVLDDWLEIDRTMSDMDRKITNDLKEGRQPDDNDLDTFFRAFGAYERITPALERLEAGRISA